MLNEEEKDQASPRNRKTYSRSMSCIELPPRRSNSKPQWNSKARACLPPLSINRPSIEEWPRAGSDDLGVWPNPPTPGARPGSITPRESSTSDQPPREFEFRKDKLAFFSKECSRILDHVYLGSVAIAKNRETLRENGITHVLNCVGYVCPEYFRDELAYKTLWLQDCPSEDITSILYDVFDFFEDVREQNGRVFVHCCQGVSRSTSLVIAYLMWKEGQSFDDAFQHVRAAREVTNPNVGFACQLLQCQKRVHALPASPTSVLRMYRMAPHSPYDPLHLVPKMVCEPSVEKLDSRGAFIVHIPSALYVWTGKHCSSLMSDNARASASQVIRYERAKGPIITVNEGEETFEFWDALNYRNSLTDGTRMSEGKTRPCLDQKKREEYDIDFGIFHGALSGGVVPPFPLSEAGPETCLPARDNGWNRLRRKFVNGIMKESITSSKLNSSASEIHDEPERIDSFKEVEEFVSPNILDGQCDSPSRSLVDTFSSFLINKPKSNSTSPSLSPSTSDNSSSFTFSPSSSNWSDLSFVSAQPSFYGLESNDTDPCKSGALDESVGSFLLDNATRMRLPVIDEASQISDKLTRYLEDDVMSNVECNDISLEASQIDEKQPISDDEALSRLQDEHKYDNMTSRIAGATSIVFYHWPSMHKVDMHCGGLDSRSVYIILIHSTKFGTKVGNVLYVWVGRNVSLKGIHGDLIRSDNKCEDSDTHWEILDHNLLIEKGFSADAQIKVVKEGEEPEQLLEYLTGFSFINDNFQFLNLAS